MIICRSNSSPKVNDNIHEEKKINKSIEGEPHWLGLVFGVECDANRKHYHGEHQEDDDKYIPVPPTSEGNTILADTQHNNR